MGLKAAFILVPLVAMTAHRTVESFNFDWNYVLGNQPYGDNCNITAAGFTTNLTGIQCLNLARAPAATEDPCACACANSATVNGPR